MNELHVVVIVSQVPEFVCKQLRKTVRGAKKIKTCVMAFAAVSIQKHPLRYTYQQEAQPY